MPAAKDKGARGERQAIEALKPISTLFKRVPSSGALEGLKGDLFIPNAFCKFNIEVKFYKEDSLSSLILNGKSNIEKWFIKSDTEGRDVGKEGMLLYKYNRSPFYLVVSKEAGDFSSNFISKIPLNKVPHLIYSGKSICLHIFKLNDIINYISEKDFIK